MSTRAKIPLCDFIMLQRGFDLPTTRRKNGNVPVIASTGIAGYHNEAKVKGPGVVIGRSGSIGGGQYAADDFWPLNTTLWVKDFKGNNPRFTYYLLKGIDFTRFNAGAGVPTLNKNHIASLRVSNFSPTEQTRIASILSAYDDLIENNRRRIQLLEKSARLLYREWFVHLRFPGHEHVKIIDGVPERWKLLTLNNICCDIRQSVKPGNTASNTPYIGLEHIPRRSIALSEWGRADEIFSTKFKFEEGDILFGKIRPYFHKVGITFTDGITSSDAIVIRPKGEALKPLTLMTVSSAEFVAVASKTVKEGSKMPRADWKYLQAYSVLLPNETILDAFNEIIRTVVAQLKTLTIQKNKLMRARDLLLPRLMNREIKV